MEGTSGDPLVLSKAPAQAGSPRVGCSGPCPGVDRVRSWAWGSLCLPAVPAGLGRRGDTRAEAVPEGSREGTMRRGVRSWECAGALMAAPPLLLSCRSTFRWQTGRQPPAWKRHRRYRGEGGLSWQGQGAGCQCWVRAPQQPRAAAGLGRTLGYGVCLWRSPSLLAMPVLHRGPWCGSAGTAIWLWGRGWDE